MRNVDNFFKKLFLILASYIVLYLAVNLFFSNYLNYGCEANSFNSVMRMLSGKSYVTQFDESPVAINTYSPLFFWISAFPLRFFPKAISVDVHAVALISRIGVFALFCTLICTIRFYFRKLWLDLYNPILFGFITLVFMIQFSELLTSLRPDFHSFLFELLGFYFMQCYLRGGALTFRRIAVVGLFTGIAICFKQNTLGVFIGTLIFMAICQRQIWRAVVYAFVTLAVFGAFLLISYWIEGEVFLRNYFQTIQGLVLSPVEVRRVLNEILRVLVFPNLLFFMFMITGVRVLWKRQRFEATHLFYCLMTSFLLATVGQFKPGAYLNYHFGFFFMGMIPAAIGLKCLWELAVSDSWYMELKWVIGIYTFAHLLIAAQIPVAIFMNDRKNYHYDELQVYLDQNYPGEQIYSNEATVLLELRDRSALSPWAENYFLTAKSLEKFLPSLREKLAQNPFSLAVIAGNDCGDWKPNGIFARETANLTTLIRRIGKICIYSSRLSQ